MRGDVNPWSRVPTIFLAAALSCANGCSTPTGVDEAAPAPAACAVPREDAAWIHKATAAWRSASRDLIKARRLDGFRAVFFSADCVLSSRNALLVDAEDAVWEAVRHDGSVTLPDGDELPTMVTSFTSSGDNGAFFVMSTPTVWKDAGVSGGALDLETLMVAVMLHEASHVVQLPTYGLRVDDIQRRYGLPDSFGDDSLQERFEQERAFTRSIARETDLFFAAAAAADDDSAYRLAKEARDLMRARAARWFTGEEAYWRETEDAWLTFEGSGQWIGYQWLTSPWGAGATPAAAMEGFGRRSRWWSQNQGLAVALTLDRLSGSAWRRQAFGEGRLTLLEMLDELLAR